MSLVFVHHRGYCEPCICASRSSRAQCEAVKLKHRLVIATLGFDLVVP